MIDRLRGMVAAKGADGLVVDVGGVGFRLEVSTQTLRQAPDVGGEISLFTHLHVREDALQLFGFATEEERALFLMLITVSKIGPRLAMAVLSARRPAELRRAIALGDVALFQAVPGIGKKTAERLILELRERVGDLQGAESAVLAGAKPTGGDGNLSLARDALVELGLTAAEADRLLRDADPEAPVQELVRRALRGR
ncbi:MAG: Holliday junction branch migration protein RuvA [Thermoleophilia bacterium]